MDDKSARFHARVEITVKGESRFEDDAIKYARYLETPEGRRPTDLTFASLQDFLSASPGIASRRILDLGCGTGVGAVRLAHLGIHVTLLDSSASMLEPAERMIVEAGVSDKITIKRGDAARLADTFQAGSFDIVLWHHVVEYVDDPGAVLCGAVKVMRDSSAILSVLVRNRAGEARKAALEKCDLHAAKHCLAADWGGEFL